MRTHALLSIILSTAILGGCGTFGGNTPAALLTSDYQATSIVVPANYQAVNERIQKALSSCYGASNGSMMMVNGVAFRSGGGNFQVQELQHGDTKQWLVLGTMIGRYMLGAEVTPIDASTTRLIGYAGNRFWKDGVAYLNDEASGRPGKCPGH